VGPAFFWTAASASAGCRDAAAHSFESGGKLPQSKEYAPQELEIEFGGDLHYAARGGTDDVAKGGAEVADVSIDRRWAVELRMIESVESLDAEQKGF
jgi:hypothetical protein